MSIVGRFGRILSYRCRSLGLFAALALMLPAPAQSEPAALKGPSTAQSAFWAGAKSPTMDEMRAHAMTIADILDKASERVEKLAAEGTGTEALMDAIRLELSLSRQWNQHLGTILDDVAEARRALGEREREAAREIARMTAIAEEARLELLALRHVLQEPRGRATQRQNSWSDGRLDGEAPTEASRVVASSKSTADAVIEAITGPKSDLADARATLASVQEAQQSAISDVDAVRAKIIDALETLADVRGDLPIREEESGAGLSSEDITAWAASTATRLSRRSKVQAD